MIRLFEARTSVGHTTAVGHVIRSWINGSDGEFVASTTEAEINGGRPFPFITDRGKWWIRGNEYCVSIDWRGKVDGPLGTEKWCRTVHPINGAYYLAPVRKSPNQMAAPYGTAKFSN